MTGWHVLSDDHLLASLRRCQNGESADLVYAELYANADHQETPMSNRARLPLILRAARHEVRCAECRVSWGDWARRLGGGR